jgi:hypothetical protein
MGPQPAHPGSLGLIEDQRLRCGNGHGCGDHHDPRCSNDGLGSIHLSLFLLVVVGCLVIWISGLR